MTLNIRNTKAAEEMNHCKTIGEDDYVKDLSEYSKNIVHNLLGACKDTGYNYEIYQGEGICISKDINNILESVMIKFQITDDYGISIFAVTKKPILINQNFEESVELLAYLNGLISPGSLFIDTEEKMLIYKDFCVDPTRVAIAFSLIAANKTFTVYSSHILAVMRGEESAVEAFNHCLG